MAQQGEMNNPSLLPSVQIYCMGKIKGKVIGTDQLPQVTLSKSLQASVLATVTISASKGRHAFCSVVRIVPATLGPYAQDKLTDAILHCRCSAGLLEGLQNLADPPWEL